MDLTRYYMLYDLLRKEYFSILEQTKPLKTDKQGRKFMDPNFITPEFRRKLRVTYELKNPETKAMNIFAEEAAKVVFNGNCQAEFPVYRKNAEKYLREGWTYTIKATMPFDSFTLVETSEFPGILFNSAAFSKKENDVKQITVLLKEYGPDLEEDLEKVDEIIEKNDKWSRLSEIEQLQDIYNDINANGPNKVDFLSILYKYLDTGKAEIPFPVGETFDDGLRSVKVIYVSDEPDDEDAWIYFCQIAVNAKRALYYQVYDHTMLKALKLVDVSTERENLTQKEQLVKDILNFGGKDIFGGLPRSLAPGKRLNVVDLPKFKAGDMLSAGELILYVSPTPDSLGNWIYFYKDKYISSDGEKELSFMAADEEYVKWLSE